MVSPMWTEEDRRELVALFAEDDRQRREHAAHCAWFAEWMGQSSTALLSPRTRALRLASGKRTQSPRSSISCVENSKTASNVCSSGFWM